MKRTGVNQGSASGHTPETGAFLPSQPGLCSEKKPCLEKGCSVRAARLAHTPFLEVFFFNLFIYFGVCFCRAGLLAGREDSVVVPRGSQWHHCGDGNCALSSPVK